MNCKNCGTENLDSSIFCKSCGTRIDGKKECPRCQNLNEEDNVFCTRCGTRIDGKVACPRCNEVVSIDTDFCPKCGNGLRKARPYKIDKTVSSSTSYGTKSIFRSIGFFFGLATILICFIFTFLIGFVTNLSIESSSLSLSQIESILSSVETKSYYIYYFFSEAYDLVSSARYIEFVIFGPLLGTICVALFLILIVVSVIFSIIAFVKAANDLTYRTKFLKWSVVTYFLYIGFIVVMGQIMATKIPFVAITYYYSSYSLTQYYDGVSSLILNGATIAGIVLSTVAMLTTLVFYYLGSEQKVTRFNVGNIISTLIILALGVVSLGLLSSAIMNLKFSTTISGTFSMGIYPFLIELYSITTSFTSSSDYRYFISYYVPSLIMIIVILVLTIAFIVFFTLMIKTLLIDYTEKRSANMTFYGITLGIILIAVGILEMILLSFTASKYFEYYSSSCSFEFIVPLIEMIIGVVLIVILIVSSALSKAQERKDEYPLETNY